jgi:hypothetical protein
VTRYRRYRRMGLSRLDAARLWLAVLFLVDRDAQLTDDLSRYQWNGSPNGGESLRERTRW